MILQASVNSCDKYWLALGLLFVVKALKPDTCLLPDFDSCAGGLEQRTRLNFCGLNVSVLWFSIESFKVWNCDSF